MALDPEKIKHLFGINQVKVDEEETDEEYQSDKILVTKKASFDDKVNQLNERMDVLEVNKNKEKSSEIKKDFSKESDNIVVETKSDLNAKTLTSETRQDKMDNTIQSPSDVKEIIQNSLKNTPSEDVSNFDSVEEEKLPEIEVPPQPVEEKKEEKVEEKVEEKKEEKVSGDLLESDNIEQKEEVKEEKIEVQEEIKTEPEAEKPVERPVENKNSIWGFNSPNPRFDIFYKQKEKLIENITPGGPINFAHLRSELRMAKVDVTIPLFDTKKVVERMQEVQKWRERLQEIQININAQYYLWKRGIDMMRGLLARAEYDKPVIKQEGVIFEHMNDMELYFSNLEAIKADSMAVDGNLNSSFDCLSRQLTITYSARDAHNYYGPKQQYNQQTNINDVVEKHSVSEEKIEKVTNKYNLENFDDINNQNDIKTTAPKKVKWDE